MKKGRGLVSVTLMGILLICTPTVFALSVGEPVMQSRLGQPLDAWIPITLDSPQEIEALDTLSASLAGAEVYAQRSLDTPAVPLGSLQLRTKTTGDQVRLHLSSQQPFLEPMSTLLIKVGLGKVSILRELTLLLDLQETAATAPLTPPTAPLIPMPVAELPPAAPAPITAAEPPAKTVSRTRQKRREAAATPLAPSQPSAPRVVSRVFQLDQSFSSYRQLVAAGKTPPPVVQQATAPAAEPKIVPVQPPAAVVPAATPVILDEPLTAVTTEVRQPSGGDGLWWILGLAFVLALLLSNAQAKQVLATQMRRIRAWRNARRPVVMPAPAPLPPRPYEMAAKSPVISQRTDDEIPDVVLSTLPPSRPSAAAPSIAGGQAERQRLSQLQRQFSGDDAKQKLKLAETYIDLNRTAAATQLMDELERAQQSGGDRRLALVKR